MAKNPNIKKLKTPVPVQKTNTSEHANWNKRQGKNTQDRRQRHIESDFHRQLDRVGKGL